MANQWLKSSFSTDSEGNCIELKRVGDSVHLRESDAPDTIVETTPEKLLAFLKGAKAGEFDHLI